MSTQTSQKLTRREQLFTGIRSCLRPIFDLPRYRISRIKSEWLISMDEPFSLAPRGTVLIICGFGSKCYQQAAERLTLQAKQSSFFEQIITITRLDQVPGLSEGQIAQYEAFAQNNPRGYGLWAWKPRVIASVMMTLPEAAPVFYLDSGCELSKFGWGRYLSYLNEICNKGSLFFSIPYLEYEWTASSVLKRFKRHLKDESYQIEATWFGLKNTQEWRDFITNWADNCFENQGELLKPILSKADRLMVTHREDQSVLSCMLKQSGNGNILVWEDHFHPDLYHINSWILMMPFHTLRSTGYDSKLSKLISLSDHAVCLRNAHGYRSNSLFHSLKMLVTEVYEAMTRFLQALRVIWRVFLPNKNRWY